MTIPMNSLIPELKEDEYEYIEPYFSGFGQSAIMCQAPLQYSGNFHKNLSTSGITDYSCTESDLPFDEFPGWDDPWAYSPVCRGWYSESNSLPE